SQVFTITSKTNYHIADVLVDGASVGAVQSYTFTNVAAIHTISVTFAMDTPLNAPLNLTATAKYTKGIAQVNLAWVDNSKNETGFIIERKIDVAGAYAQIATVGADVKKYADTAVIPDTMYYYRVCASNSTGKSSYSNEAGVAPLLNSPSDLTAAVKSTKGVVQINLAWKDNSKCETGFIIERKTGVTGAYAQIANIGANTKKYIDTAAAPNAMYYYRVCAVYKNTVDSSYSDYSNEASATPAPGAPLNLSASVKYTKGTAQVSLAWKENSKDETGFIVERKTGAEGAYAQIANLGANTKKYLDTTAIPDTMYYYRVYSYNTSGNSPYSNEVSIAPLLNAPLNLTTAVKYVKGNAQVNLGWKDNSKCETGFVIERKTEAGGTYAPIATVGANIKKYIDAAVAPDTTYYYRVCAVYKDTLNTSYSDYSNEASATPLLNAPSNLAAAVKMTRGVAKVNLTWKDNSKNEIGFIIERKTGAAGIYSRIATVGANIKKYTDTSTARNTKYYYRVYAHDDSADSAYSNEAIAAVQ
ncbi:MAG: fibronectin type III domain-containing protein, partial [Candidatus Omnitrophica bacterium]|nr:fibronectin type III domain-containing protein [Candidatus Omnitrophota bacterium]